jgi:hypothetical protein
MHLCPGEEIIMSKFSDSIIYNNIKLNVISIDASKIEHENHTIKAAKIKRSGVIAAAIIGVFGLVLVTVIPILLSRVTKISKDKPSLQTETSSSDKTVETDFLASEVVRKKAEAYLLDGNYYEARGDQAIANYCFPEAEMFYEKSIFYLRMIVNEQKLPQQYVKDGKEILLQVEQKKDICRYGEIFHIAFSPTIDNANNYDIYFGMEELASVFTSRELWKNASLCYSWLLRQNITSQRRMTNIESLRYVSERWEFSGDFVQDISANTVNAVINSDNVNFREDPILLNTNVIRKFRLYEDLKILQRSGFKQNIGTVNAYWYEVVTDEGIKGWVYGQYIYVYPVFQAE